MLYIFTLFSLPRARIRSEVAFASFTLSSSQVNEEECPEMLNMVQPPQACSLYIARLYPSVRLARHSNPAIIMMIPCKVLDHPARLTGSEYPTLGTARDQDVDDGTKTQVTTGGWRTALALLESRCSPGRRTIVVSRGYHLYSRAARQNAIVKSAAAKPPSLVSKTCPWSREQPGVVYGSLEI
ncbi:hypothetical protein RhiJN_13151 [Ceratobasidium sp. AG-Ba]|nr:hypothetical protein RhiJN_00077 [Ceratobasidium sp. AG-Ba]QRV82091.1 hypothetical protein RhiJN_10106 [Ceratobasidium sp. AG-Ba]QRV85133.1 hypothetical protein RhiJN_13151 [Ceratobasidium sp. AG-Ba]